MDLFAMRKENLTASPARPIEPGSPVQAAVAMTLKHAADGLEILLIERAYRENDPWSGHLGLPGGRVESNDIDLRRTAERETREEVGLDLTAARHLLRLDDLTIPSPAVRVSSFVYGLSGTPTLRLDPDEVVAAYWIPLTVLQDPARRTCHAVRAGERLRRYPALRLLGKDRPLLWGITYRLIRRLLALNASRCLSFNST